MSASTIRAIQEIDSQKRRIKERLSEAKRKGWKLQQKILEGELRELDTRRTNLKASLRETEYDLIGYIW
jgi:hypothetical protein